MRYVTRVRTLLILGEEVPESLQEYWDVAKASFPKWIGFSDARCSPDTDLQRRFRVLEARVIACIEREAGQELNLEDEQEP